LSVKVRKNPLTADKFVGTNVPQKGDTNMPLTDVFLRNLKPADKRKNYKDSGGLYLYATTSGLKSWRFNYRFQGKQLTLTFGTYPLISLKEARDKLVDAKRTLKAGIDPGQQKKSIQEAVRAESVNSFEVVAREWFARKQIGKDERYTFRIWARLEKDFLPFLASRPINEITSQDVLEVLRKIEARGAVDTSHRCLQYCGQIFRDAVSTGRVSHDVCADLRDALSPAVHEHRACLTDPSDVGGLLRAIDDYSGNVIVMSALKMAPYVFVRPGELRHAEWPEVDLDKTEWRIPAEKMKMKQIHIVP
jgi:hypothetical protein